MRDGFCDLLTGAGRPIIGMATMAVGALALMSSGSISLAYSNGGDISGSRPPVLLPLHLGKPDTSGQQPSINRAASPSSNLRSGGTFNMMGWPWVKHKGLTSHPSQQQINQDLRQVLQDMSTSARRLNAADAGPKTQKVQEDIIARLDELIKMAQQSQSKGGGRQQSSSEQQSMSMQQSNGGQNSPMNPSNSATQSRRPGGTPMNPGNLTNVNSRRHQWGNLPARERNMILNAMRHQTLPQYKSLVQQYYESLAKLNQSQEAQQYENAH